MDVFFVLRRKCVNGDETLICSQRSVHATLAQVMVVIPSPTDENGTTGMEHEGVCATYNIKQAAV